MPITPQLLLSGYCQGIFPMADEDEIFWYDPDPRAIIPLDSFHIPRSLQRVINSGRFEVRVDTAFSDVMRACAAPGDGRETTWISEEFVQVYTQLHQSRLAHSVETWLDGELVGGLYGVSLGGFFAGESMFHRERDASKVALVHLVERMKHGGYTLLDVQFMTPHLRRFGAIEVPRKYYKKLLAQALQAGTKW
ncbi:MAG: leucyl/phenylalanyl-tRNA--protein transferase [Ardenticatenaceae bacterium]|nr:leucyl/phenylalanyl-tRNA--protein transferase [Ardenticatenaceae bacterium]